MTYKGFEIDDNKIDDYVERLECSISEACDLILEESGKVAESAETTKAIKETEAKGNGKRHYEKSGKPRKPSTKERKVDAEKGELLRKVKELVEEVGATETALKTETELSFALNGNRYTFKLTKHRPPKK